MSKLFPTQINMHKNLTVITKNMLIVADEINNTNQNMKLLERKIKQISTNLGEFTKNAEDMTAEIPEGDILYQLQDMIDVIGDIEEIMRREALIGLTKTANKMVEFTSNISNQAIKY